MGIIRRHIKVNGRVQGVGYRYFVLDKAQELGLTGWVRNNADGSVSLEAQGAPERIDSLLAQLECGPPLARIDHVQVCDYPVFSDEQFFIITH